MKINKSTANPLYEYFKRNDKNLIHKWLHYFDIYHRYFEKFRGKDVVVLEFGVSHGGSLQMWKSYFGKKARIIGVDINPECKELAEQQIEIYIGSQEDPLFLKKLMDKIGAVDILIDDGGHTMLQQNTTFDATYSYVKPGGIYLAEDLHTSYWSEFGGGYRKQNTFIERSKGLVDALHAWHSRDGESLKVDDFTRTTYGIHFYDSIVVFEKQLIQEPSHEQRGKQTLNTLDSWEYRKHEAK
jgi:hypothetical protein